MAGKHAPIEVGKYLEIHNTSMRTLERAGRVLPDGDGLTIERVERGLLISGRIHCAGGVTIHVDKLLVVTGKGPTAMAQTTSYTYQVMVEGLGDLFRYCGPHGHRPYHHKHEFDVLKGDAVGIKTKVDPEERPTLAEVITEACDWYFQHGAEVEARRPSR